MKLSILQTEELRNFLDCEGECPTWLQEFASNKWTSDIPYGTLTGDTGTMDEWLSDRTDIVRDYFHDSLEKLQDLDCREAEALEAIAPIDFEQDVSTLYLALIAYLKAHKVKDEARHAVGDLMQLVKTRTELTLKTFQVGP